MDKISYGKKGRYDDKNMDSLNFDNGNIFGWTQGYGNRIFK